MLASIDEVVTDEKTVIDLIKQIPISIAYTDSSVCCCNFFICNRDYSYSPAPYFASDSGPNSKLIEQPCARPYELAAQVASNLP